MACVNLRLHKTIAKILCMSQLRLIIVIVVLGIGYLFYSVSIGIQMYHEYAKRRLLRSNSWCFLRDSAMLIRFI